VVALELIKAIQETNDGNEYFIFVRNDMDTTCLKSTENVHIIVLPAVNYILWEQILLPYYALKYQIDLLHCTSNTAPLWVHCPVVLTLHDVIYLEKRNVKNTSSLYQKLGNLYRRFLVPVLVRRVEKIVTISKQECGNILATLPSCEGKLSVIYNGVSRNFGRKLPKDQGDMLLRKLKAGEQFILFLGNVEPRKNTPNVLKAFAEFAHQRATCNLVITGVSREFVQSQWPENSPSELLNQVITPGFVSNEELFTLYERAQVYLFPSLREGFGLPILEAMSYSTPVITSNLSSMPEVAGEAALLVNPMDASEIARALTELIDNPELRETLTKKGLERVAGFSWETTAKEYQKIYSQIVSETSQIRLEKSLSIA
jgi:glycosyltransferase involved in cell wall biosynthesis